MTPSGPSQSVLVLKFCCCFLNVFSQTNNFNTDLKKREIQTFLIFNACKLGKGRSYKRLKYLRTRGNKWAYRCFLWPPLVQLWLGIDFHTAHKHRVHIFCQVCPRACNTAMEKNKNKFIYFTHKVEKVLKGSLNSISSPLPSVKIQIVSGKVCLRLGIKAKHWWVLSTTFANEKFVDITQQCFALLLQCK